MQMILQHKWIGQWLQVQQPKGEIFLIYKKDNHFSEEDNALLAQTMFSDSTENSLQNIVVDNDI